MKFNFSFYLLMLTTLMVSSCKQDLAKVLTAVTDQIMVPVSVTVTPYEDLGEVIVGEEPVELTVTVKNNSSDRIQKLALNIDKTQTLLKFKENEEGIAVTPGLGGTCGTTLSPGKSCKYIMLFNPRKSGVFNIPINFNYENLIEPQTKTFTITALTGEPASLVFTNDTSTYNLGVLEQTEPVKKLLQLEVANMGGLSARDIEPLLVNSSANDAFKIEENTCPKILPPLQKCTLKLSYMPYNNNYTDPTIEYKSQLTFSYLRDSKNTKSSLNGYFSFISATIEAKFKENFKTVDFGTLYTGNKLKKSVRVTNTGYREGIIKEMIITDDQGNALTTCKKAATGNILDCNKDLKDFPYLIEDTNSCFENPVLGIVGSNAGESCYFGITYWPSLTWESGSQSIHYFNHAKISLKYDSQWKGEPNIVVKNEMFELFADFLSAGKMALTEVAINNMPMDPTKITYASNSALLDFGRVALVSSNIYTTLIKITWKNVGENIVIMDNVSDKHSPIANLITDLGYNLNPYFLQIKTSAGCGFISPGASCSLSFNLAPVVQASASLEDGYMFDDLTDLTKKIKTFALTYNDGSKFEDDGTAASLRTFNSHLTAKLIKKGSLAFTSPTAISNTIINGNSLIQNLCLTNVGTGEIYAIVNHATENFNPSGRTVWPYKVQDLGTVASSCPTAATKDCYDIIYPYGQTLPMVPDQSKFLAAGETCVLSVEIKAPETYRVSNYGAVEEHMRPFSPVLNNTSDAWARMYNNTPSYPISYKYYDGDYISDDPLSFLNYGYTGTTVQKTNISTIIGSPANIVLQGPTPITSAVLYRPSITAPTLSNTYPTNYTLAAKTVPETFFTSTYFTTLSHGFTKANDAITHVKALNLRGGTYETEYKVHIGTFPVGQTNFASFSFINVGSRSATSALFTEDSNTTSPIQVESFAGMTGKPFPGISISQSADTPVKLKFTPVAAGLFKRCFNLNYNTTIAVWDQKVCVYGEAVAAFPKLKIEHSTVNVAMPGPTETPTGTYTVLNAANNGVDGTSLTISGIKGSAAYTKKIFRITNIGTEKATKLNYFYMDTVTNAATPIPSDTVISTGGANPCSVSLELLPGAYCEFYVKYTPTKTSTSALTRYLGFIYEIAPGSNQYLSQVSEVRFSALDPAKLAINGSATEAINDWSNPAAPFPVGESWPLDLMAYNRATTPHNLLVAFPQPKTFSLITVKNLSLLKASFLYMNPTPVAGTWNDVYSNAFISVKASRPCFYGDDESNAGIPADQKGFNSATTSVCQLSVVFTGHQTYSSCSAWNAAVKTKTVRIGDLIDSSCNPYSFQLGYYNNNRSSYETMNFHVKGFIEPNRSTTLPTVAAYSNVTSTFVSGSLGRVGFTWPELKTANSDWGSITKYRIYYDLTASNLNGANVFKLTGGPAFVETANNVTSVTISNLAVGKYYYFKVMAVRTYGGISYLSDTNMPLLTLPIPATDHVYDHASKSLIDKTYLPAVGNRPAGIAACGAKFYNLIINGATVKRYKGLVTTPIWNYLNTMPSASTGYPPDGIGSLPHWLGDNSYDMKTVVSLYDGTLLSGFPGYLSTAMSGNSSANKAIFQKNCNNTAACDLLFKIVGGDDVDLYYKGVFYAKDTAVSAYARCSAVINCPTNTAKVITDGTCALP